MSKGCARVLFHCNDGDGHEEEPLSALPCSWLEDATRSHSRVLVYATSFWQSGMGCLGRPTQHAIKVSLPRLTGSLAEGRGEGAESKCEGTLFEKET